MKNSADLGGCYPGCCSVDNTLLDRQNFSYPTQPHSIIILLILWMFYKYSASKQRQVIEHFSTGIFILMTNLYRFSYENTK